MYFAISFQMLTPRFSPAIGTAAAAVAAAAEQDEQDNDYPEAAVISVIAEHSFDLSPHLKIP